MAVSPNVLAGIAAALGGGLQQYNQRDRELAQQAERKADNDRADMSLQRALMKDEIGEWRQDQRDHERVVDNLAAGYSQRPDALVSPQDAGRLQTFGHGAMLGQRPAAAQEDTNIPALLRQQAIVQGQSVNPESFVRPTDAQLAQRQLAQRQAATFDDADRKRGAAQSYYSWLQHNPSAPAQQRFQRAQELGIAWTGYSPAEQAAEDARKFAQQRSLANIRHDGPAPQRLTESERLFQSNPWEFYKQEGIAQLRGSMSSLAATGADPQTLLTQIDSAATKYANQRYAAWQQGQQDDQARKQQLPQQMTAPTPQSSAGTGDGAASPSWDDKLADDIVGLKPGQPVEKKRVVELVQQMADQDEATILQAVKWARQLGVIVSFGDVAGGR